MAVEQTEYSLTKEIQRYVFLLKKSGLTGVEIANMSAEAGARFTSSTLSRSMNSESEHQVSVRKRLQIIDTLKNIVRAKSVHDQNLESALLELEDASEGVNVRPPKDRRNENLDWVLMKMKRDADLIPWAETKRLEQEEAKEIMVITPDLEWICKHIYQIIRSLLQNPDRNYKIILTEQQGTINEAVIVQSILEFTRSPAEVEHIKKHFEIKHLYERDRYVGDPVFVAPILQDIVLYKLENDAIGSPSEGHPLDTIGYFSIFSSANPKIGCDSRIPPKRIKVLKWWFEDNWKELDPSNIWQGLQNSQNHTDEIPVQSS